MRLWLTLALLAAAVSATGHTAELVALVQEGESEPPTDVATFSAAQFAGLMNALITRASRMRVVMNKLGISDTDSQQVLEARFVQLGNSHADLGEGMNTAEEFRKHGLKARSCVKYAGMCSRQAAGCSGAPKDCFSDDKEVEDCTRAAVVCGVGVDLGESNEPKAAAPAPKEAPKAEQPDKVAPKADPSPKAKAQAPKEEPKPKAEAPKADAEKPKAPAKEAPKVDEKPKEASTDTVLDKAVPVSDDELELLQLDLEQELPALIEAGLHGEA